MKRLSILVTLLLALLSQHANAQDDKYLFNHLGAGVSLGLEGLGFELAVPATNWAAVRLGMSFLPQATYSQKVDVDFGNNTTSNTEVEIEGKLKKTDFKILFDFYPIPRHSFRLTAGAYIGSKDLVTVNNKEPLPPLATGIQLGDYEVRSDMSGKVNADIKVNSFKPYLGVGFGRAVPSKYRLSFNFDAGVQFWGTPGVWTTTRNSTYQKLEKGNIDNDDSNKFFDVLSKMTVYPVISLRLNGRIF